VLILPLLLTKDRKRSWLIDVFESGGCVVEHFETRNAHKGAYRVPHNAVPGLRQEGEHLEQQTPELPGPQNCLKRKCQQCRRHVCDGQQLSPTIMTRSDCRQPSRDRYTTELICQKKTLRRKARSNAIAPAAPCCLGLSI
jgi:hypothetical protein